MFFFLLLLLRCLITWPNNPGGVRITSRDDKARGSRLGLANGGSQRRRGCHHPRSRRSKTQKRRTQTTESLPDGLSQTNGKPLASSRRTRPNPDQLPRIETQVTGGMTRSCGWCRWHVHCAVGKVPFMLLIRAQRMSWSIADVP